MKPFSPDNIVIFGAAVVITGPALLAGPEYGCVDARVSVPFNYFFPSKQIPMHSVCQDNKNTHDSALTSCSFST